MSIRFRSHLTYGVLLASTCLAASIALAASDTPASPPSTAAPQSSPAPKPDAGPLTVTQKPDDQKARWRADREAFFSARLAALHAGLQLKPDQETLWPPVETAIRGFAKLRADHWAAMQAAGDRAGDADHANVGKGGASINRLRHGSDRLIARGQAMKMLADAAAPFMASLDATQKDRLPRLLEGMRPKRILDEAFAAEDGDRGHEDGERDGWRRAHHDRMERYGMHDGDDRDRRERDDGRRYDRGDREHGWGHTDGYAERDGMRGGDRSEGDETPTYRHRHHDDEEGSDRT